MKKCLNCNEVYNDDWYSCPKCGNILEETVKANETVTKTAVSVKSSGEEEEITQAHIFSKLPAVFYIVGFIILLVGTFIALFFTPKELSLILTRLWATFITALLFIGFGKVIELLDTIKWKL